MKSSIGFVISTLSGGGAQRVVSNLSLELSSRYQVYIILHDGTAVEYPYIGKVVDLNAPAADSGFGKALNTVKRVLRLRSFKKNLQMKAVISFMENANFINILSGKVGKRIISVRIYKKRAPKNMHSMIFRLMMKLLYNRAECVVAPSYGIKQDLIKSYGINENKIKIIYNPCNVDLIHKNITEGKYGSENNLFFHPTIISVGRLTRQKGQWHLIRAFKAIKEVLPQMKLVILGEGPLEKYLKKLTSELDLSGEVQFLGFQNNPFKYMASSSIYVMPSLNEGFPNVLIEAMACGVPVIAADCLTGPREILAPGTDYTKQTRTIEYAKYGILTPVCDGEIYAGDDALAGEEKMIVEAVVSLFSDAEYYRRYKEKALERVLDFQPGYIAGQWIDLIESNNSGRRSN